MPYDPQRSHRRPQASDDDPAPVDALLAPAAETTHLPDGVTVDVEEGEVVVHTPDADVEVSTRGDDVIVHTETADVEVFPDGEEVIVSSAREELVIDLTDGSIAVDASSGGRRRALVPVVVALAVLVALVVWRRRHR